MSSPENNYLVLKSTPEVFREIASKLIDKETGYTTFEKICPVPAGLTEEEAIDWIDGHYNCLPGYLESIDEEKSAIDFTTNWRCAQDVIECLASQYPQAGIEFWYTICDDDIGILDCHDIYENGVLVSREQILDPNSVADWDEEDE